MLEQELKDDIVGAGKVPGKGKREGNGKETEGEVEEILEWKMRDVGIGGKEVDRGSTRERDK